MFTSPFLLVAVTAACILWAAWRRPAAASSARLNLPMVDFEDANTLDDAALREKYIKDTGVLLRQGYEKVNPSVVQMQS